MAAYERRIALNFGGSYVPGLNAVTTGTARAAGPSWATPRARTPSASGT